MNWPCGVILTLLALSEAGLAQDFSAPISQREIPIIEPRRESAENGQFHFILNPLTQQPGLDPLAQTKSVEQGFGLAYQQPLCDLITLGYYNGADFFRQDTSLLDNDGLESQISNSWLNKASLALRLPAATTVSGYAQTQRGFVDSQSGFSDAVKYGAEAGLSPVKDVTVIKAQASTQQARGMDNVLVYENIYAVAIEQKLPWTPMTLRVAESATSDRTELLSPRDKDAQKIDAALLWKIRPEATWSTGLQQQNADLISSAVSESSRVYFTEFQVQPVTAIGLTLRAAQEAKERSSDNQILTTETAVVLSLGTKLKLAERWNAGFGLSYRVPSAQSAATPGQTTFSVSAGGSF